MMQGAVAGCDTAQAKLNANLELHANVHSKNLDSVHGPGERNQFTTAERAPSPSGVKVTWAPAVRVVASLLPFFEGQESDPQFAAQRDLRAAGSLIEAAWTALCWTRPDRMLDMVSRARPSEIKRTGPPSGNVKTHRTRIELCDKYIDTYRRSGWPRSGPYVSG